MTATKEGSVGQGDVEVGPGDCMNSIAFERGFYHKTLWDLPENSELKEVRKDPFVLRAGDRVFVPEIAPKEESRPPEQRHVFRRKGVPAKFTVVLRDGGAPRANESYRMCIDGEWRSGKTDADGLLTESIPPNAKSATLVLGDNEEEYTIDLGQVDPIDVTTGIQDRLRNLGFYVGENTGELDDETQAALAEFQKSQSLPGNGELSDETRDALKRAHGN